MATLASAIMAREILAFIGSALPALGNHFGAHARSSFAAFVPTHENRPAAGRSVALVAPLHPKCPFQAEALCVRESYRCFLVLGYYEVSGLYGRSTYTVNTAPYLSSQGFQGCRLHIELLTQPGRVVRVLLRCRGMGAARPIQTKERNLD